jgi:hypothetical protein
VLRIAQRRRLSINFMVLLANICILQDVQPLGTPRSVPRDEIGMR